MTAKSSGEGDGGFSPPPVRACCLVWSDKLALAANFILFQANLISPTIRFFPVISFSLKKYKKVLYYPDKTIYCFLCRNLLFYTHVFVTFFHSLDFNMSVLALVDLFSNMCADWAISWRSISYNNKVIWLITLTTIFFQTLPL